MEEKLAAPVPDGEVPKSDVEIVSDVLTEKCPSSTFLKNVGLRPSSSSKSSKSNAAVTAHVHQLEEQLEMSQQQARAMREEMAAMKKKAAEAEAAQAERDKFFELLLKKTEENDARFLHMMAMFAGKPTGN
jgi:predicted AAA+ superfamily ATPase